MNGSDYAGSPSSLRWPLPAVTRVIGQISREKIGKLVFIPQQVVGSTKVFFALKSSLSAVTFCSLS
jgi:hypothetical protein